MNYVEIFEKSIFQAEKLIEKSRKTGRKVIEKLVGKPYNEFDGFFGSSAMLLRKMETLIMVSLKTDYHIRKTFVVSKERTIKTDGKITYLPIYDVMFF